jgi:hypothetical protein
MFKHKTRARGKCDQKLKERKKKVEIGKVEEIEVEEDTEPGKPENVSLLFLERVSKSSAPTR